jgi:hypothetical protein
VLEFKQILKTLREQEEEAKEMAKVCFGTLFSS